MIRRVVHIMGNDYTSIAPVSIGQLVCGLPRDEFELHVMALGNGPATESLRSQGVEVNVLGQRWKFDSQLWLSLRRAIVALQPQIVHTWAGANTYGRTAAIAAGVRHLVASESGFESAPRWREQVLARILARRSDAIVCNGQALLRFYQQRYAPGTRLRYVPNGVPLRELDANRRARFLAELNLPAESRLIGAVEHLNSRGRIEDLIWATDLLKVIRDNTHLVVIGGGPWREALHRFRRSCRIEDRVHLVGSRSDVDELVPCFDLLWSAAGTEGLPGGILRAMACGLPVVASSTAGSRELIVHGESGFLTPVGDRAGLARYAHKLLEDSDLANRLGRAGRARIEAEFSVSQLVDMHAALYREIMDVR